MESSAKPYVPEAEASRHTISRNALVFTAQDQLRPEHQDHPERYRFCARFLTPQDRVLDCACGCGYGSAILAAQAGRVVGVDLEADLVEFARQHWGADNIEYRVADICAGPLPYPEGSFTAIVSLETLEHVPQPAAMLREFRRLLAPQGWLAISTPQRPLGNPHHVREYLLGELAVLLEQAGFAVREVYTQPSPTAFIPGGSPAAGRQNLVLAGAGPAGTWYAGILDRQYLELLGGRGELASSERRAGRAEAVLAQVRLELANARENNAHLRGQAEALIARRDQLLKRERELMARVQELEARVARLDGECQRLANLRVVKLYHRLASSRPYRLLRRLAGRG